MVNKTLLFRRFQNIGIKIGQFIGILGLLLSFWRATAQAFFVRFEGNSILPKGLKLDYLPWNSIFFPMKLDFSAILRKFYIFWWILEKNMNGVTLFIAIWINKIFGEMQKYTVF